MDEACQEQEHCHHSLGSLQSLQRNRSHQSSPQLMPAHFHYGVNSTRDMDTVTWEQAMEDTVHVLIHGTSCTPGEEPPPSMLTYGINVYGVVLPLQLLTPHDATVPILHLPHLNMMDSVIYPDWECIGKPRECHFGSR